MNRSKLMAGTCVLTAGVLLAFGPTAHYAVSGPLARSAGQMGGMKSGRMRHGMMGQNMTAAQEQMETILDKLMQNHKAMTKARSMSAMRPLLEVNHTLLERLRNEMNRTWGMHRHGMGSPSSASPHPGPARRSTAPAKSRPESKLVARGRHLFNVDSCRVCHGPTGHGTAMAPSLRGVGKKYPDHKIAHLIRHPVTLKMPSFSESAISDADLKSIIAFLHTLK